MTTLRLTPRAERVLNLAELEAVSDKDVFVGLNHILIGMLMEGNNSASLFLAEKGITLDEARRVLK